VILARQGSFLEQAALFQGARPVWNALFGLRAQAATNAAAALSLYRSREADCGPAFALALPGDSTQAHRIVAELEKRYPEDTSVQFSYLPALRGRAYSRMGRHREAAAEFQKILDHPALVVNDPIAPMARLQQARALSASGDGAKSAAVYKELFTLWKDADSDVPVVQEAKAESAR